MKPKILKNLQSYHSRPIRFVDRVLLDDWQIKLYWISWKGEKVNKELVERGIKIIHKRLKSVSNKFMHYNIGFGIIHEGKDGTYAIISYWIEENMLDHMVFMFDTNNQDGFKRLEPDSIVTCVWELEVLYYEKVAWIDHVLKKPADLNAYLNSTVNVDI